MNDVTYEIVDAIVLIEESSTFIPVFRSSRRGDNLLYAAESGFSNICTCFIPIDTENYQFFGGIESWTFDELMPEAFLLGETIPFVAKNGTGDTVCTFNAQKLIESFDGAIPYSFISILKIHAKSIEEFSKYLEMAGITRGTINYRSQLSLFQRARKLKTPGNLPSPSTSTSPSDLEEMDDFIVSDEEPQQDLSGPLRSDFLFVLGTELSDAFASPELEDEWIAAWYRLYDDMQKLSSEECDILIDAGRSFVLKAPTTSSNSLNLLFDLWDANYLDVRGADAPFLEGLWTELESLVESRNITEVEREIIITITDILGHVVIGEGIYQIKKYDPTDLQKYLTARILPILDSIILSETKISELEDNGDISRLMLCVLRLLLKAEIGPELRARLFMFASIVVSGSSDLAADEAFRFKLGYLIFSLPRPIVEDDPLEYSEALDGFWVG